MRGEYENTPGEMVRLEELPPRARRIHLDHAFSKGRIGTTSACAENTFFTALHCGQAGNYLRVRGEYSLEDTNTYLGLELPPRARRIHLDHAFSKGRIGTTSACAENTFFTALHCGQAGNYLRVRGEYSLEDTNTYLGLELPPRARRIPIMRPTLIADGGNYLRVRREYRLWGR